MRHSSLQLRLAAEEALGVFETVLGGVDHKEDPVTAIGSLLAGLRLVCEKKAGGSEQLWFEAIAAMFAAAERPVTIERTG